MNQAHQEAGSSPHADVATAATSYDDNLSAAITRRSFLGGAAGMAVVIGAAIGTVGLLGGTLAGCASLTEPGRRKATDGTYSTISEGYNGPISVDTVIEDGAIASVTVTSHTETEVFTVNAIPQMCKSIVTTDSYGIDAVSGATTTCKAIEDAVGQAIAAAGGSAVVYNTASKVERSTNTSTDCDVAVVGGGLAGLIAAARAAEAGCKVVLIEKVGFVGGCSLASYDCATYYGDDARNAASIAWLDSQGSAVDTSLIRTYLYGLTDAMKYIGTFDSAQDYFPNGIGEDGSTLTSICDYTQRPIVYEEILSGTIFSQGGEVYTQTTGNSLLKDDAGNVIGVICTRNNGSKLTVNAKSVVIATGGFGGDSQLVKERSGYDLVGVGLSQDVGEGMQMAWDAGAKKPGNLGGLMLNRMLATAKLFDYATFQQRMPMICGYIPSLLDVTSAGARFRNEGIVTDTAAAAISGAVAGGTTYVLLDQYMLDKLSTGGTAAIGFSSTPSMPPDYLPDFQPDTPWDSVQDVFNDMVIGGWGFIGDTLEDLAGSADMDPAVLQNTFDTYQSACTAAVDAEFGKDPSYLIPYQYGPYYLVQIVYGQLGSIGGIVCDNGFNVLDVDGSGIGGLFSAGADCFGTCWARDYRGSGDGIGFALTSGYLAGDAAAAWALGKTDKQ